MKFTVITKDGSKWLRPINPHPEKLSTHGTPEAFYYNPEWQEFEKNNFDAPYLGSHPEGTTLGESEVREVRQHKIGGKWHVTTSDLSDTGFSDYWGLETRTAYTDAESHSHDISDDYWRKRCEAAERFIAKSPCDPDITNTQEAAYDAWQEIVKQQPK